METLLKVDLSTIKEQTGGVLELTEELHLPAQGRVEFPEPVTVAVQVTRTNQGYYVTGKIHGRYQVPCDRCLEMIWKPLTAEFSETFYDRRSRDREENDKIVLERFGPPRKVAERRMACGESRTPPADGPVRSNSHQGPPT